MSLAVSDIYAGVVSHARRLGVFNQVLTHEPKAAPPSGLTCSIWLNSLEPIAEVSGLAVTSLRLELSIRIYENFKAQPEDDIDKRLLDAASKLMESYTEDFTLDGDVMDIDLLGAHGEPLRAEGGYLNQSGDLYRVVVMTLPIIIADVYTQVP
jgi:hypothetical protein